MDATEELSQDSGLESPRSKGNTPERRNTSSMEELSPKPAEDAVSVSRVTSNDSVSYDDEPDETLAERLWGLSEMFPDCVVSATHTVTTKTWSGVKYLYSCSRSLMWIAASSSVILFAPVFFELEIAKIEEKQKSEEKQFLLGPSAAMTGSNSMPPLPR